MPGVRDSATAHDGCEFSSAAQARVASHGGASVWRQPLTSLAPAACKHAATAFTGHARFKSVIAFAAALVRLVRPFHEVFFSLMVAVDAAKNAAGAKGNC
jgi:hypothetical protein